MLLSIFTLNAGAHYVGSKNLDVYHYPSCHYVDRIKSENLIYFDTPEDAIAAGYRPCKVCKPPTKSSSPQRVVDTNDEEPELYVDPTYLDFGEVRTGEDAWASFYVENTGGGVLEWGADWDMDWIEVYLAMDF